MPEYKLVITLKARKEIEYFLNIINQYQKKFMRSLFLI